MKKKKLFAALLAGTMLVSTLLMGCGGEKSNGENASDDGEAKDSVVFAIDANPADFGPNDVFQEGTRHIVSNVYGRLWYYEGDEIVYRCAKNVEYLDDTHIKIELRDDVDDSQGNHMTSEDIMFVLEHLQETPYASFVMYVDFENSTIDDEYSLTLQLTQPYNLQVVKMAGIDIYDKDAFEASPDGMVTEPVGYGPYKFDNYVSGSGVDLSLRDDYFEGDAQFKNVRFEVITESSQRTNALINGDVDIINRVQGTDIDYINETDGLTVQEFPNLCVNGIVLNCNEASACSDVKVRQAIAYAIDAQAVIDVTYNGYADEVTDTCSLKSSTDVDLWKDVAAEFDGYYQQDIDKAKELLKKAGYPNGDGLNLQIVHYGGSGGEATANQIQSMLAEAGIDVAVTQYDQATLEAQAKADPSCWDIYINGWLADSDVSYDLISLHMFGIGNAQWSGSEADHLAEILGRVEQSSDEAEIAELTKEIHEIMDENIPYYSLANIRGEFGTKEGIKVHFWNASMNTLDFFTMSWE